MTTDRLFDTFPTVLGNAKVTPSQFAIRVLDTIRAMPGGLPALLDRFRDNGFDDAVRSWIGKGSNFTLGPQDVQRVLGAATIDALAREAVISPKDAATEVASLLPQLVDKLTPGGVMPDEAALASYFEQLKAKIGML